MVRLALAALLLTAASPSPSKSGDPSAVDTSRVWLQALRDGKVDRLLSVTRLPFAYYEAWPNKQCAQVAKDEKAFGKWYKCIRGEEDLLIAELMVEKEDPDHIHLTPGLGETGDLRKLVKVVTGKETWVSGFINGDGVTYSFLFALAGNEAKGLRVVALVMDTSFDGG